MSCSKCMDIPDELIVEILKRLPVKSLLIFMSVCKSWYSLIKNPNFISSHFNHQRNQGPKYLVYRNAENLGDYYVYQDSDSFEWQLEFTYPIIYCIIGCCNGIFCFNHIPFDTSFVLWNSFLRKSLEIEVPHCILDRQRWTYWFGFDELSNDYKLVWFGYLKSESGKTRVFVVYIYSLNERTWRRVNSSFVFNDEYLIGYNGVYLNGVIHLVAERDYEVRFLPEVVLTFSLADETFDVFNLPSEIAYKEFDWDRLQDRDILPRVDLITVKRGSKDCLAAIHEDLTSLNLWVMEEEGIQESWRKDFSISSNWVKRILSVRMNGEIVIERRTGGVVSLNHRFMRKWKTRDLASLYHRLMRMNLVSSESMEYVGTYMESLLLL